MKNVKSSRRYRFAQALLVLLLSAFILFPILSVIGSSFKNPVAVKPGGIKELSYNLFSINSYLDILFHDLAYWVSFWNSIFLAVPSVILTILISTLAAYGLCIRSDRWTKSTTFTYILLALLPSQVLLVPNYMALSACGLIGSRLSIVLVSAFNPYYVYFIYRFCSQLSSEAFEAARIEGAGEFKIYLHIALPQMAPAVMTLTLIGGAELWNMIEQPLAFIQTAEKYPLSVLFSGLASQSQCAGAILFSIPIWLLFFYLGRDLADGIEK